MKRGGKIRNFDALGNEECRMSNEAGRRLRKICYKGGVITVKV